MVLLSFDIEEFDMPLEYGGEISLEEQLSISQDGLTKILDLLDKHKVKATFFSTVVFAEHSKKLIQRLLDAGHELASHTYYHSDFKIEHLRTSKEALEKMFPISIKGLRMPRMMPIDEQEVFNAGYEYNSSINPTYLPGRYNNLSVSRTYFTKKNVLQIPASVSPMRIPLFWLSFHNFPQKIYRYLANRTIKKDGYLNLYFHPWEFSDIKNPKYKLPAFTTKNTNQKMVERFENFIIWLKNKGETFETFETFMKEKK